MSKCNICDETLIRCVKSECRRIGCATIAYDGHEESVCANALLKHVGLENGVPSNDEVFTFELVSGVVLCTHCSNFSDGFERA